MRRYSWPLLPTMILVVTVLAACSDSNDGEVSSERPAITLIEASIEQLERADSYHIDGRMPDDAVAWHLDSENSSYRLRIERPTAPTDCARHIVSSSDACGWELLVVPSGSYIRPCGEDCSNFVQIGDPSVGYAAIGADAMMLPAWPIFALKGIETPNVTRDDGVEWSLQGVVDRTSLQGQVEMNAFGKSLSGGSCEVTIPNGSTSTTQVCRSFAVSPQTDHVTVQSSEKESARSLELLAQKYQIIVTQRNRTTVDDPFE